MDIGIFRKKVRPGFSRRILILAVMIMASLLVAVFIRMRMGGGQSIAPDAPETSEATLTINQFHHTATKDGETQWILDAAKAEMYADANKARLKDIRATFFARGRRNITLEARKGELDLSSKNMSVSGEVIARYSGYVLRTENLHYRHDSNIINSDSRIHITGENIRVHANSATFELDTGRLMFDGNVESWVDSIAKL